MADLADEKRRVDFTNSLYKIIHKEKRNNMKVKKLMALVLVLCMALSCMGISAFASESMTFVATIGNTGYTTLEAAISAVKDGETIVLADGTHAWNASWQITNKAVTFTGSTNAVINMENIHTGQATGGATLTFSGVTLKFANADYCGFAHTEKVVYNNCVINGKQHLYANTVSFTNCILNNSNDYCVWTYGAKDVTFTGCTFNTGGKAILVYNEATDFVANITLTNCIFNDDDTLNTKKAAVETGIVPNSNNKYNLTFSNCQVNGFAVNDEGTSTGSTLWANKNDMDLDKEEVKVIIDGVNVNAPVPVTPSTPSVDPDWTYVEEEEEDEPEVYKYLSGKGQTWTQNNAEGLVFKIKADFDEFRLIRVDNKSVSKKYYTVEEGSTIVTLKPEYLNTLTLGKHKFRVVFEDGYAECTFEVKKGAELVVTPSADKTNPSTGANDFVGVAAALAVISAAAAVTLSKKR